jgi:hypothetical protein
VTTTAVGFADDEEPFQIDLGGDLDNLKLHGATPAKQVGPSPDLDSQSPREHVLDTASDLVMGDRNNQYGPPHQDFQRAADILTALGFRFEPDYPPTKLNRIQAHHMAMILASVKLSRLAWGPGKADSWVDLAGYAACGYEAFVLTEDG